MHNTPRVRARSPFPSTNELSYIYLSLYCFKDELFRCWKRWTSLQHMSIRRPCVAGEKTGGDADVRTEPHVQPRWQNLCLQDHITSLNRSMELLERQAQPVPKVSLYSACSRYRGVSAVSVKKVTTR